MMPKTTKLERSNKAHTRLFNKHIITFGSLSEVKAQYHVEVLACQRAAKKVLPRNEKRLLYKYNQQKVYGSGKGKSVSSKDYLGIFKKYNVKSL